jgi:hypothetical protein
MRILNKGLCQGRRGPCLIALTLYAAVWGWSYLFRDCIDYTRPDGSYGWIFEIGGGEIAAGRNWGGWTGEKPGWNYQHLPPDQYASEINGLGVRILGFQFIRLTKFGGLIKIPLWFPIGVIALVFYLLGRKARQPRGFEVVSRQDKIGRDKTGA